MLMLCKDQPNVLLLRVIVIVYDCKWYPQLSLEGESLQAWKTIQ
jgi:hypothetical protein